MLHVSASEFRHRELAVRLSQTELQGPIAVQRAPALRAESLRREAEDQHGLNVRGRGRARRSLDFDPLA